MTKINMIILTVLILSVTSILLGYSQAQQGNIDTSMKHYMFGFIGAMGSISSIVLGVKE